MIHICAIAGSSEWTHVGALGEVSRKLANLFSGSGAEANCACKCDPCDVPEPTDHEAMIGYALVHHEPGNGPAG